MLNGLNDDEVIDNEQMPSDEEDGDDNPELLQ
jgi:flagellar motor component MotA